MIKYKRILLKLSGEAFQGEQGHGIDTTVLNDYAAQVKEIVEMGVELGIVIGGGNIFRGLTGIDRGFDRVKGDYMGMLATVINGLAFQSSLECIGVRSRVMTAIPMPPIGEPYSKNVAEKSLSQKEVIIFSAGTGNPFFTTDSASSLRALEIGADVLLKGTRVDGIYDSDPEKNTNAKKYETLTFDQAIEGGLKVMDMTSFALCKENFLPIIVFNMNKFGNLKKVISGENIGTLVKNKF
ncbi:MAG: UMP kinase [Bacteroidales bacterium]|nr:UMP kinase [Bacteroidales bacterium]